MIAIIDYGVGNLFSLSGSLNFLGLENKITSDCQDIINADQIILPGVGAFRDAIEKLEASGLIDVIKKEVRSGKPLLGICLGMQLLFNKSYEYGVYNGLGLIDGEICPIIDDLKIPLKVPHMGWNKLEHKKNSRLLKYTKDSSYVYYVHSFYAKNCENSIVATSEYGIEIPGVVENGNVFGTQFHPEKSGEVGLTMLRAFAEIGG